MKTTTKETTTQEKKQTGKIRQLLFLQDANHFTSLFNRNSKRKFAVATFMIISSLLPYADMFLDYFINTKEIESIRFPNLSYAIWAYGTPISAMLVLLISKVFNPPKWTYIATIYVNLSQIFAYIYLQFDLTLKSDWIFRIISLICSLVVFYLIGKAISIYHRMKLVDDLREEFLKERSRYEQENV